MLVDSTLVVSVPTQKHFEDQPEGSEHYSITVVLKGRIAVARLVFGHLIYKRGLGNDNVPALMLCCCSW